jgi:hypothetical protein
MALAEAVERFGEASALERQVYRTRKSGTILLVIQFDMTNHNIDEICKSMAYEQFCTPHEQKNIFSQLAVSCFYEMEKHAARTRGNLKATQCHLRKEIGRRSAGMAVFRKADDVSCAQSRAALAGWGRSERNR